MGRGRRKRSSSAVSEKMERVVAGRKNGRTLFDRPKPTVGCSANGRRRRLWNVARRENDVKCNFSPFKNVYGN